MDSAGEAGEPADTHRVVDQLTQAVRAKAFRGELVPTEAELARREPHLRDRDRTARPRPQAQA